MKKSEQYQRIILETNNWYETKINQLKMIISEDNEKILFTADDGEEIELPKHLKEGFELGIQTAIEVLGAFPVKISKTDDSN